MLYVIELKIPGYSTTYFAKSGGYTSDETKAKTYSDYNEAYRVHERLSKSNPSVANYGKVVEL